MTIICAFMASMFCSVHFSGCTPRSMAAFSAGRPNASQPMGCKTWWPCMRLKRARTSDMVYTRRWPRCSVPDGYGNMGSTYALPFVGASCFLWASSSCLTSLSQCGCHLPVRSTSLISAAARRRWGIGSGHIEAALRAHGRVAWRGTGRQPRRYTLRPRIMASSLYNLMECGELAR